jgi:hypothetical protein
MRIHSKGRELKIKYNNNNKVTNQGLDTLVKGKCTLGPFLSILVIECQHKCLNVIHVHGRTKCKSRAKVCF